MLTNALDVIKRLYTSIKSSKARHVLSRNVGIKAICQRVIYGISIEMQKANQKHYETNLDRFAS